MVGRWVDQDDDDNATIETVCNWTKNRNFLTRSYAITVGDDIELSGIQVIGWDPAAKTIRSWTFDSDGGFAEATWDEKGDRWYHPQQGRSGRRSQGHNDQRDQDNSTTIRSPGRQSNERPAANCFPTSMK